MIDNGILKRIAEAMEKIAEELGAIDQTLNRLLVVYAGTVTDREKAEPAAAPEPIDDLGLCCQAPTEADVAELAAQCRREMGVIHHLAQAKNRAKHPDEKTPPEYSLTETDLKAYRMLQDAESDSGKKRIPIEDRIKKMKSALDYAYFGSEN